MAAVTGLSKERMVEIEASSVVGGTIDVNGNLVLTRHNGDSFSAGYVIGPEGDPGDPGSSVDTSKQWDRLTTYPQHAVVGYSGRMWKATASSLDKPPLFNTDVWKSVTGGDSNDWYERDPYFSGKVIGDSHELFWGGGTRSFNLTNVAGEFETGTQALKMTMGVNANYWLYSNEENVVRSGDKIVISVRAKVLSASVGATLRGLLSQNTPDATPAPFITGHLTPGAAEPQAQLTTAWATYTFTITPLPGAPRARALVMVETAANAANIVIDYLKVERVRTAIDPTAKTYVDSAISTAVSPLATSASVTSAVAAVNRPTTGHSPVTPVSNFNVTGSLVTEILSTGKRRLSIDLQLTRAVSNYGVIPATTWTNLSAVLPASCRFAFTKAVYLTGWSNVLEGAIPLSVHIDGASGNIMVKAIPGHTTTMNIGHFFQINATVVEA